MHLGNRFLLPVLAHLAPLLAPSSLSSPPCPEALVTQYHLVLLENPEPQAPQGLLLVPLVDLVGHVVQEHQIFQQLAVLSQMG